MEGGQARAIKRHKQGGEGRQRGLSYLNSFNIARAPFEHAMSANGSRLPDAFVASWCRPSQVVAVYAIVAGLIERRGREGGDEFTAGQGADAGCVRVDEDGEREGEGASLRQLANVAVQRSRWR